MARWGLDLLSEMAVKRQIAAELESTRWEIEDIQRKLSLTAEFSGDFSPIVRGHQDVHGTVGKSIG
jgi:hypothetical protein